MVGEPKTTNTQTLTEAGQIKRSLDDRDYDRWGFVIYRCTYDDDAAWDQFKNVITTRARKEIQDSDHPEILASCEWKFFDARETFDKASADSLREHFNQWVRDNWQREQPRGTFPRMPRYQYFIRVDREALDSILSAPGNQDAKPWVGDAGWVDFIDAGWTPELDNVDSDTEDIDMPDLDFEPIEGCREEDVGWMKVPAERICTELYSLFDGARIWDVVYKRPPEVADWV